MKRDGGERTWSNHPTRPHRTNATGHMYVRTQLRGNKNWGDSRQRSDQHFVGRTKTTYVNFYSAVIRPLPSRRGNEVKLTLSR